MPEEAETLGAQHQGQEVVVFDDDIEEIIVDKENNNNSSMSNSINQGVKKKRESPAGKAFKTLDAYFGKMSKEKTSSPSSKIAEKEKEKKSDAKGNIVDLSEDDVIAFEDDFESPAPPSKNNKSPKASTSSSKFHSMFKVAESGNPLEKKASRLPILELSKFYGPVDGSPLNFSAVNKQALDISSLALSCPGKIPLSFGCMSDLLEIYQFFVHFGSSFVEETANFATDNEVYGHSRVDCTFDRSLESFIQLFREENEEEERQEVLGEEFFVPLLRCLASEVSIDSYQKQKHQLKIEVQNWPTVLSYFLAFANGDIAEMDDIEEDDNKEVKLAEKDGELSGDKKAEIGDFDDWNSLGRNLAKFWFFLDFEAIPLVIVIKSLHWIMSQVLTLKKFNSFFHQELVKSNANANSNESEAWKRNEPLGLDRFGNLYYRISQAGKNEALLLCYCKSLHVWSLIDEVKKQELVKVFLSNSSSFPILSERKLGSKLRELATVDLFDDEKEQEEEKEKVSLSSFDPNELEGEDHEIESTPAIPFDELFNFCSKQRAHKEKARVLRALIRLEFWLQKYGLLLSSDDQVNVNVVRWTGEGDSDVSTLAQVKSRLAMHYVHLKKIYPGMSDSSLSKALPYQSIAYAVFKLLEIFPIDQGEESLFMDAASKTIESDADMEINESENENDDDLLTLFKKREKIQFMDKWCNFLAISGLFTWNSLFNWIIYFDELFSWQLEKGVRKGSKSNQNSCSHSFLFDQICMVCEDPTSSSNWSSNGPMLLCDWCDNACHSACYTGRSRRRARRGNAAATRISGQFFVPENNFYCKFCQTSIPFTGLCDDEDLKEEEQVEHDEGSNADLRKRRRSQRFGAMEDGEGIHSYSLRTRSKSVGSAEQEGRVKQVKIDSSSEEENDDDSEEEKDDDSEEEEAEDDSFDSDSEDQGDDNIDKVSESEVESQSDNVEIEIEYPNEKNEEEKPVLSSKRIKRKYH